MQKGNIRLASERNKLRKYEIKATSSTGNDYKTVLSVDYKKKSSNCCCCCALDESVEGPLFPHRPG